MIPCVVVEHVSVGICVNTEESKINLVSWVGLCRSEFIKTVELQSGEQARAGELD